MMTPETIASVRRVLLEVGAGIWIGHHIRRLNSYGPELLTAFRALLESESDPDARAALWEAQGKLLNQIKALMRENHISQCLDAEEIDRYLAGAIDLI